MKPGSVTLAYLHRNELTATFHESMFGLLMWDASSHGRLLHADGHMHVRCGSGALVEARNETAKMFLAGEGEWLLVVDDDMGFQPDSLDRLLAVADKDARPIVGGLCFIQRETGKDGLAGFRTAPVPTIFDFAVDDESGLKGFHPISHYPVNTLVRCAATGSAFVLIHRSVLVAIREQHGERWYDRIPREAGGLMGEDVSFCVRAGACGFPVHVHTGVRTSHVKTQWVQEADFWSTYLAPPATAPTAVLVPVMRRPQNAEPFMRSLRASTGLAAVYALAEPDDTETAEAWRAAGATVIDCPGPSFAVKVNHGYRSTTQPWMFVTGDDVRFHPGWLDHAQHVADVEHADLVGTNDLGNPRVTAGEHAVHFLVRRSYVDDVGASWDGPGVVCHEGYRHWYVDDEIVTAAKRRNRWAMALGSIVEHLHPMLGKGKGDDVYQIGQAYAARDKKLHERRRAEHLGTAA